MAKLLLIGDPHFSIKPPVSRKDNYAQCIIEKFEESFKLAKKLKVDYVGCTGDFFHRKANTTFSETITLLNLIKKSPVQFIGIGGNHDYTGYNIDSINRKALGVLVSSGYLHLLDQGDIIKDGVCITGSSYNVKYDIDRIAYVKKKEQMDYMTLAITHGSLVLSKSGSFWGDYTNLGHLSNIDGDVHDVIFNGHMHHDQGVKKVGDSNIFGIGSLARNVLKEDVSKRIPRVAYIDIKDGNISHELIELKCAKKHQDVFLKSDPVGEDETNMIREFVEVLKQESGEMELAADSSSVNNIIDKLGYGEEIKVKVLDYLENVDEY